MFVEQARGRGCGGECEWEEVEAWPPGWVRRLVRSQVYRYCEALACQV